MLISQLIEEIYSKPEDVDFLVESIESRVDSYKQKITQARKEHWDEDDVFLITYGDQFSKAEQNKLKTFRSIYQKFFADTFPIVHFLPFYPYTSDDGFSVVDYEQVNPEIGDWADVQEMNLEASLMFDFVCNHMSAESSWFQGYLNNQPAFKDFFIDVDPSEDLSTVTRPRTIPLLTKFQNNAGEKNIWTTFSADQVDLNFENPKVLLRMLDVLLFYIDQGARYIRLDAIGFLWKKAGTSSIHLDETHKIVQLFRAVVEAVAPGTVLITETNVPHKDNISYFGDGTNEAQMVYQFPLPPLVLYSIRSGNTDYLKGWAKNIQPPSKETTFFNFLASHDGIGLNPIRGIVEEAEILDLVEKLKAQGALVNYKKNPDGSDSPYEINTTYMDALSNRADSDSLRLQRFLLAHSVLLSLPGVPAVYIQSILGSRNYDEGVKETGANRTINREKYSSEEITTALETAGSFREQVYSQLKQMIKVRRKLSAFHPDAEMTVLETNQQVFGLMRGEKVIVLHNMSDKTAEVSIEKGKYLNLLSNEEVILSDTLELTAYQFIWLSKV